MLKHFKIGGIHPDDNKLAKDAAIETMPQPARVVIPLAQHIGAPALASVAVGDMVKVGQLIGSSTGLVSANIHSSVSGKVTSIALAADLAGRQVPSVTIDVEGDLWEEEIDRTDAIVRECSLSAEDIVKKISQAGIVGMGGAAFPTQVKLAVQSGRKVETLIINGAECEPYLAADYRLMLERGEETVIGAAILAKSLGVKRVYIGVENNKPEAITNLRAICASYENIEVVPLRVKYPQGGEKQMIDAILGRRVPTGGLPVDVGVVVHNVGTALAVYEAVQKSKPLIDRVVTVTGKSLPRQANLQVRIGTPISSLIDHCGGLPEDTMKVISGGPMMGRAVANLDAPITKGTSGVVLVPQKEAARKEAEDCIRCGKCVKNCSMGLEPYLLYKLAVRDMRPEMEQAGILSCIECGSCSFSCPAQLPLVDYIRLGKSRVAASKKK